MSKKLVKRIGCEKYVCDVRCEYETTSRRGIELHIKIKHNSRPSEATIDEFRCRLCGKYFNPNQIKKHGKICKC